MIESHTGYQYTTKVENLQLGALDLKVECLTDIDKTIDDLFIVYNEQGRKELFEEMCPYFGILWPAGKVLIEELGRVLSREVETRPEWLRTDRILEVGCGLALPSLLLEKAGYKVSATDQHPDVPAFLRRNRELNGLTGPHFIPGDWRSLSAGEARSWDLIIGSDVLYDKTQPATLLDFFERMLSDRGMAIVADPGRGYLEGFLEDAHNRGFVVHTHGVFGVMICELSRK